MKGAAHITGGGLVDNPTRMFAAGAKLKLQIDPDAPGSRRPCSAMLARLGNVAPEEMRRTFNMGIGMIVAVPAGAADAAQSILELEGEKVFTIGSVQRSDEVDAPVEFVA
jgi:phosphoribosylaminoimidazole (AIR) synthetase